ncbi:MAG: acyl-CoA reductase-like NAD-dependent aldehyde dehydrogenase [Halioglobus sp.]|jgi:acyl-CoA reductase-like NAD-dependent aldehyde dehydrogenase
MTLHKNYIDGQWVGSTNTIQNINPSNINDCVGEYASASLKDMNNAFAAATCAFSTWSRSNIQFRSDALDSIGNEILSRKDELGDLLAREEGKVLVEATGEVMRAGHIFKFFSGEALRLTGETVPSVRPGVDTEIRREPVGVIGIITPWNFPIAIPSWKIAPALAYGNTVVFKPASLVTGSAWALAEIISRSGIPAGVFNMVAGSGDIAGNAILQDPRVSAVSFTGSVSTGSRVAAECSARGAKYQLEMGGKNPQIVLDDASIDLAVNCSINSSFLSTGQRCTASSRIIVTEGIYDQFVDKIVIATKALKVGNARDPSTQIGPVADHSQLKQDLKYITIGNAEGASLACGGERLSLKDDGFYLSPALFIDTSNTMQINRDEIFGPIAAVMKVSGYDEAVAVANDTPFGLSAGICTKSLKYSSQFKRDSKAGMVMINLPTAGVDYHVPFGGTKGSSYGSREQGSYAKEFYTTVKTIYTFPD